MSLRHPLTLEFLERRCVAEVHFFVAFVLLFQILNEHLNTLKKTLDTLSLLCYNYGCKVFYFTEKGVCMPKNLYISALLDVYGAYLNEKQRELCEYYYNDDLSLAEIAENVGITRQGVRDLIKRAEQTLISLEESCRYCERFLKLKELSAKARGGDKTAAESIFDIIDEL